MSADLQYQPTVPHPPPAPPPPRGGRKGVIALLLALAALAGLAVGLAVSMESSSGDDEPAAADTPALGTLEVVSHPDDGAVTVDGRLVGLTPIDRLDLDPGRHAVVIDVYGYQPYVGTIEIAAGGRAALEAHLAPLGTDAPSTSTFRGAGKAIDRAVPRSALVPAAAVAAAAEEQPAGGGTAKRAARKRRAPAPPRRDCSGERSTCRESCDDAHFDCWAACDYCGSCTSDKTWDECNRICKTCRDGCEQNKKFCESSCEGSYRSCSRS